MQTGVKDKIPSFLVFVGLSWQNVLNVINNKMIFIISFPRRLIHKLLHLIMQQERPSLPEDISPDLQFIIQSCWVEDPNMRPSFSQIIRMLNSFLFAVSPSPPSLNSNTNEAAASNENDTMSDLSARARGKFAFIRHLFSARKTKNTQ